MFVKIACSTNVHFFSLISAFYSYYFYEFPWEMFTYMPGMHVAPLQ